MPVGIVSIHGNLIENLYVLPGEQGKGYGSRLLDFAEEQCSGTPTLWILSSNHRARRFYKKHGHQPIGKRKQLSDELFGVEFEKKREKISNPRCDPVCGSRQGLERRII